MRRFAWLLLFCATATTARAAHPHREVLQQFLKSYCVQCHGPEKQHGDRRFDRLFIDQGVVADGESLQEILDQLNLAAMPPEDERQPSAEERKQVVALLTRSLAEAREAAREHAGKIVMRRMNRTEYRNTIRDLFQLKMVDFDPTTTFPPDNATTGFDNVGEGLVTSDYLLHNYLEAARKVADKAILHGPRPPMIRYRIGSDAKAQATGEISSPLSVDKNGRQAAGRLFVRFRQPLGVPRLDKKRGVPTSGEYVIRLSAEAVRRKSRYKDEDLRYNSDEPMRLSISIDSRELGATAHRIIGEYEVPDHKVIDIEHRVWLEKGFTFHIHWANGPNGSFKRILRKVLPKYHRDALYPIRNPPEMYVGSGPELQVHTLELEGPFYEEWPPAGFARFFPSPPQHPDISYLDASLLRIASVAFRRPVRRAEIEPYLHLARNYYQEHDDFWDAAKYGVRALLTSPNFLYFVEPPATDSNHRKVSDHELATRLSYFLWSSMPDEELRTAADDGNLSDPRVLRQQVARLLSDPKSSAFTENFTGQWLGLRMLGKMPPDPEENPDYYEDQIEEAMRQETQRFFAHILNDNRSVMEFVDADYTFLNPALARHYGISPLQEAGFQKVTLTPESHRGGLLGHGSILTATSNGVETQPVVRGIWVLENLFGSPPNPPPPDVDPIEPDTRGVKTIRQLMEKHRENPTCYECHRKIDPIGLSLENYDHVGVWRDRYKNDLPLDASAKLPDGTDISGPRDIKRFLIERPEQFVRCLTQKLLIYALGRRLSFADRDDIDLIVSDIAKRNYGFQELVQLIVTSEAFHTK